MITVINGTRLRFSFPSVHRDATCDIDFVRTHRVPDDGSVYKLPDHIGALPLRHLDDYQSNLPPSIHERGGIILPLYQSEAFALSFEAYGYPFAIKVGTGKRCVITLREWEEHLNSDPQDYLVVPNQNRLDGYVADNELVRQFVAMPLGADFSVEKQLSGVEEIGGVQICVFPLRADKYLEIERRRIEDARRQSGKRYCLKVVEPDFSLMSVSAGAPMIFGVEEDKFGLDSWEVPERLRCFVTIANALQWQRITNEKPPAKPLRAKHYKKSGVPWHTQYKEQSTFKRLFFDRKIKAIQDIFKARRRRLE